MIRQRLLQDKVLCIFCDNEVGTRTKPEHILLDALGGRMTTKWADCNHCNQSFGGTIDKVLPEQLRMLRNMFQMKSGSGQPPPGLSKILSSTGTITLDSRGRPKRVGGKPFTITPLGNERYDVSFSVDSMEEFRKYVAHAAAAIGVTEDHFWAKIEGQYASFQNEYPGTLHSRIQCGGEEVVRSMVKSSLVLLATHVGTMPLKGAAFAQARDFVVKGSEDFLQCFTAVDARDFPESAYQYLLENHGPMFNLIYVRSDDYGRTLAYYHAFNIASWQMVLAEKGGPRNIEIGLASDPLNPARWDGDLATKVSLDFDWLNAPDGSRLNDVSLARVSTVLKLHQDVSRERTIQNVLNDVLGHYYDEGDMIEMDEKGRAAIIEISQKLVAALMQIPTKEKFLLRRSKQPGAE